MSRGLPSPKFQLQAVSKEVAGELSVKVTHNGTQPDTGDAVKLTTGNGAMVTLVVVSTGGHEPDAGMV